MMIDVRIEVEYPPRVSQGKVESAIIHDIVSDVQGVRSAVVLRNNGFAALLPDENTRQER